MSNISGSNSGSLTVPELPSRNVSCLHAAEKKDDCADKTSRRTV